MPEWMQGDILDVRMAVSEWLDHRKSQGVSRKSGISRHVSRLLSLYLSTSLPPSIFLQLEIDDGGC